MELVPRIKQAVQAVLDQRYQYRTDINEILVNETKPEFSGDYTVLLFSISKTLKTNPVILGKELGTALLDANRADAVQLDIASMPAGVYIIRVNNIEVQKFVKQ